MEDAQTDKPLMGRNQKIGLGMWACTMLLTFGYIIFAAIRSPDASLPAVLSGQLATWVAFVTPFTVICLGVILGGSAGLKVAEIFASKPGRVAPK